MGGGRAPPPPPPSRCGFIALGGAPNAGKSTLLNRLVGSKISIVTPKVQTTRSRIIGIVIAGEAQLVFVDTPGIFAPRRRLERAMVAAAWGGLADADIIVLLVDTALCIGKLKGAIDGDSLAIIKGIEKYGRQAILALNKIDLVKRPTLLELAAALNAEGNFSDTFMISAFTGDGVADLRAHLATIVPEGPWLYDEDQLSDIPLRLLAAEITREQAFLQLHQELPYALTVETEDWQERDDGSVRIEQTFYVRRGTQKAMVLGKGGSRIKSIGVAARAELERVMARRVHLFIHVKVRRDWIDRPEHYRAMGLDFKA
ncbi:MAG: GTPase Era [Proteobacteria bacterium]|nr:GTPase Era [Pseudomonadota bacterium]